MTKYFYTFQNCQFFSKVQCIKFILQSLAVYLHFLVFPIFLFCKKMTKNLYHTEVECAEIAVLHKNGLAQCQISEELRISKSSVQRAIAKFKTEGIHGK